jgi:hypothetical protein
MNRLRNGHEGRAAQDGTARERYRARARISCRSNGAALADLLAALEGKLSRDLDVQVLMPHPTGHPQKGTL